MRTFLILAAAALPLAGQETPKKKVMCTLPVLQAIAQEVGGPDFEVTALSKPDQDPHFVSPTPTLAKKLLEADLFIEIGLQLELWADEIATNRRIQRGQPGRLVASTGIPREEVPKIVDRSQGDVHPEGNPHVWLDPLRAKALADNIAGGLKAIAPDRKAGIDERLGKFKDGIDRAMFGPALLEQVTAQALTRRVLDGTLQAYLEEKKLADKLGGWMKKAAPLRGQKVVEYHKTWVYFGKVFGFEIVGSIEPKPGISPTRKHLAELEGTIKDQRVRILIMENYQDPSNPQALAERTGSKVATVPSQPGGEAGDYGKMIDHILDRLLEASR